METHELAAAVAEIVLASMSLGHRDAAIHTASDLVIKPGQMWATAEQLAHRYSFKDTKTILRRAVEFGGAATDDSPGARMRFKVEVADAYWDQQHSKLAASSSSRRPAARRGVRRKQSSPQGMSPAGNPLVAF